MPDYDENYVPGWMREMSWMQEQRRQAGAEAEQLAGPVPAGEPRGFWASLRAAFAPVPLAPPACEVGIGGETAGGPGSCAAPGTWPS